MLDDSFHQRYCFSEEDQQLFREKAVALAHLFLHLPSHHIIRLGGGKCALNENSFGLVLSSAQEDLVLSDMRAWRGAREGASGILCPSCWQGIPLQSLKGSGSQSSQGSAAKRESESHLGSSRRLCSLQYVSNNKSSHRAGLRVFWNKALTALNCKKVKAPGLSPDFSHESPGAMLAHRGNLPHILPTFWCFSR